MNTEKKCQSCKYYKDGYCEDLELKPLYPEKACDYFSRQKEMIRDAFFAEFCEVLRDNGIFVSSWIPISEDLPKENETVIASTKYGVYPEARYIKEYGWEWAYEAGADYWKELEGVTAWMPLPKTYKPQESEEQTE